MTTRAAPRSEWGGFALWAGAGVLVSMSLAGAASIGLFLLPFAVVTVALLLRRGGPWPEVVGGAAGLGVVLLVLAALNLDYSPCTEEGISLEPGERSASCGGWNPLPFAVVGAMLLTAAVVAYAALRRAR